MNKTLFSLILAVLLLSGCAARIPEPAAETQPATAVTAETLPVPAGLSMSVLSDRGALRQYSLSESIQGFLPLNDHLVVFSGETASTLTLLDPLTGKAIATHEANTVLTPQNATVQILDNGLSYFDGSARETVLLDPSLREVRRIAAPEDMTGMPLLSKNSRNLYYCTGSAVRVLDTDSGISRILKEAAYPVQSVTALLLGDSVLQVSITEADGTWQTLFLSSENGQLQHSAEGNILPATSSSHYFLSTQALMLCGSAEGSATVLTPRIPDADCCYLPSGNRLFSAGWTDSSTVLECYDLNTGRRTAELLLPEMLFPEGAAETSDGAVWFLSSADDQKTLFRWDPGASAISDDSLYMHPYYTRSEPDYDGLAACSLYAREIGERYGIEILVYRDAVAAEPWDYHLEYEYQASVLQQELQALETRLVNFPEGFLTTLRNRFTALKICIVQSITGSPESGSPAAVNGIQFLDGYDAYIVLATDRNTEYALYHELSHLMETVILTESTAYDRWEDLNPEGFEYDYDYFINQNRSGSDWLQTGREYFIDTYSMSYPKEDRARLFEYAMTGFHEERFRSPHLQSKLRQMCTGIREAFGLRSYAGPLPWEQYLLTP